MLAVLVFGSELERQLGRWRFLALYLLSALGGAAAIQLFGNPFQPVAGASTAIYGLLGALGVLMIVRRQDLRGLLTLLAINIFISFLPGVSLLGHLGGLVAGAVAAGDPGRTRRRPPLQIVALAVFAVLLLVADAHRADDRVRPLGRRVGSSAAQRPGHLAPGRRPGRAGPAPRARRRRPGRPRCPAPGCGCARPAGGSPAPARAAPPRAGGGAGSTSGRRPRPGPAVSRGRATRSRAARTSSRSAPAPTSTRPGASRTTRARARPRATATRAAVSPARGDHCTGPPSQAPRRPHPERDRPLRREPLARSHRRACRPRSERVNGVRPRVDPGTAPGPLVDTSTAGYTAGDRLTRV